MSKQINLVINGKGVVKELLRLELCSVFERLRHRSLSDRQRAILKRFIAVATPLMSQRH